MYDITYTSIGAAVVEDFYDENVVFLRFCFEKETAEKEPSGPAGPYPADGLSQSGPDRSG